MVAQIKEEKRSTLEFLVFFAILCLLVWTNPPIEKHRERVAEVAAKVAGKRAGIIDRLLFVPRSEGAGCALGLKRFTLGVCSVGYSRSGWSEISAVSFGALGGVLVFAW
jgi:hypothetical protein